MPPKAAAARKPRAPKGHKLPPTFPPGEILQDMLKKQWKLGPVIGQGGFGLIYLASDDLSATVPQNAAYVIKIEPRANGPLFCELHFYQRCCKPDMVDSWLRGHKLKYLGVPKFIGHGSYTFGGQEYRFMVMQRFSTDLQKLFDKTKRFPPSTVLCLGLRMLDCLEYLHDHHYVHADVKAANILLGYKNGTPVDSEVYLVDFGLAFRYFVDNKHREYKEDPKKQHDGTIEFTSRDAHLGVLPSRRGDLEILGYCLLQWLCGRLPWEDKLNDKNYVRDSKIKYMKNIPSLMKTCSVTGDATDAVSSFLSHIVKLDYDETPNYTALRKVLRQGLTRLGVKDEWKLHLQDQTAAAGTPKPSTSKPRKRKTDHSDDDLDASPNKKKTPANVNGHARSSSAASRVKSSAASKGRASPAARPSPSKVAVHPSMKARSSPAVKKKAGTPKSPKGSTPSRADSLKKGVAKRSPKKTEKRRRKKVVTSEASIQTTPTLARRR